MAVPPIDTDTPQLDDGSPATPPRLLSFLQSLIAGFSQPDVPLKIGSRIVLVGACVASVAFAQSNPVPNESDNRADWIESDPGIPVTDATTIRACGTCHQPDEKGNLSRISWIRATPEGWSQAIKRMVTLNGATISPADARAVVKYLSTAHGLAPEEALPVMYIPERRMIDETNIPNETLRGACASCHAFGQPLSSRRSRTEWALLQNMHVAMYPQADWQYSAFAEDQPDEAVAPEDKVTRGEVALDWLSENAGLVSPEWSAWSVGGVTPNLAGKWLVSATLPGKGRYVGEMEIAPRGAADEFETSYTLRSLSDGSTLTRQGSSILYAGNSWRGVSDTIGASADEPNSPAHRAREAMWFAPDQQSAVGRWYWGEYHEFGFDVSLTRAPGSPAISAVGPALAKAGSRGLEITIFGADLPVGLSPADFDLGSGVVVKTVVSSTASSAVVAVDIAADAAPGLRSIAIGSATLPNALPVFDTIDYLKITPETALSRLGGLRYDKGYQQFDAVGYANGADGLPNTDDDFAIGSVPANWSMQEFSVVTYDDDVDFVGTLDNNGLFTPSFEGPNEQRRFQRNNYGDVWVVATAKDQTDPSGRPLTARAYLVVTVPSYKRWDQPEVSE